VDLKPQLHKKQLNYFLFPIITIPLYFRTLQLFKCLVIGLWRVFVIFFVLGGSVAGDSGYSSDPSNDCFPMQEQEYKQNSITIANSHLCGVIVIIFTAS